MLTVNAYGATSAAGPLVPMTTQRRDLGPGDVLVEIRYCGICHTDIGFDCPALDTLFLAAPVANKGSLTQYVGRILRTHENKTTTEVHDYLDEHTCILAAMLATRAPGYTGLGFPTRAGAR